MTADRPVMRVDRLWLQRFRSYAEADFELDPGFTAVLGANGTGKTNLLEAVAYLSRQQSFRGASPAGMVQRDATEAVVRGEAHAGERELLIEAQLPREGRGRMLLNRQRVSRRADVLEVFQVSVLTPDDLVLVKGGPAMRRDYLDELLVAAHPRHAAVVADVERILRQRNALLKQMGRRPSAETLMTLDVWDARLAVAGDRLGELRAGVVQRLSPHVVAAYDELAGAPAGVTLDYLTQWRDAGLAAALATGRDDDIRRAVSTVGPHRDELLLRIDGLEARHQASQGEQRSLAFALRLAAHRLVVEELGSVPVLLLDDVFSELDPTRASALLRALPGGQVVLTSATGLPQGASPDRVIDTGARRARADR